MSNNQPQSRPNRGAPKTNPTRTYSQTQRPSRKKAEIARRIFIAKCIIVFSMIFVLGGGVYLLSRSGLFKSKSSKTEKTSLSSVTFETQDTSASGAADTTPAPTEPQGSLAGYTVILDPGHGGRDDGCGWPLNSSEVVEKDISLQIVKKMEEDLTSRGAKVYVTRTTDTEVGIYYRMAEVHLICMDIAKERGILPFSAEKEQELRQQCEKIKEINEWDKDKLTSKCMGFMAGYGANDDLKALMDMETQLTDVIFISIHLNSTDKPGEYEIKHGMAVHYPDDEYISKPDHDTGGDPKHDAYYGRHNEWNSQFSQMLYDQYVELFPEMVSYSKAESHLASAFAVIREHGLVGVLVEVGFITNPHDREFFGNADNISKTAISFDDTIEKYFLTVVK